MIKKTFTINSDTIKLPAIGQGCMGIGGKFSKDYSGDKNQIEALRYGIEQGMTLIDTAEVYGAGHAEELVGKAIEGCRPDVIVATKFSPENNGYENVLSAAERSLKRLNTDYIDIYQMHWPNPSIPLEETLRAMELLVDQGKVRYIGVSNFYEKDLREAATLLNHTTIFSNQLELNLFDRFAEISVLPFCMEKNMAFLAYSPLDKGRLAPARKRLEEIAKSYDNTVAQIILNWLIRHPNVIAIPKAIKREHLKQNAASAEFRISKEHCREIDRLFPAEPSYIDANSISVSPRGEGNRKVYRTVEEAIANPLNFAPSPLELAEDVKKGDPIKPVRLVLNLGQSTRFEYDLVEGRIRYWAWYIAFEGKKPIPAYIR